MDLNFESKPEENLCTPSRTTQSAISCRRTVVTVL